MEGHGKLAVGGHIDIPCGIAGLKAAGHGIAGGIGQRDLGGEENAVVHVHRVTAPVHHLLGNDQIALADGGVDEIHIVDEVGGDGAVRHGADRGAVHVDGLDLIILVGGDLLHGVGGAGRQAGQPEGLIATKIYVIGAGGGEAYGGRLTQRDHVQSGGPALSGAGVGGAVRVVGGDAEGEIRGGAGLVHVHRLGQLNALRRCHQQAAVVAKVHIHVVDVVLLGQIGVEHHMGGAGGVHRLFLIIHLQLAGGGAGRHHVGAGLLAGDGGEVILPHGGADRGGRHPLVQEHGRGGRFVKDVAAVIILARGRQGLPRAHQHVVIAHLLVHGGIEGVVEALVLQRRRELGGGGHMLVVGGSGNVEVVGPELSGHTVGGDVRPIGDAGDVELVKIAAQTALEHQANGCHVGGILHRHGDVAGLVHVGALQGDKVGHHRHQGSGDLPQHSLRAGGDIGAHLHGHIHHIGVLDTARGLAQEAVGLDLVHRTGRDSVGGGFIPEAHVGAIRLGIPADVVGPVVLRYVLELPRCKGASHQRLSRHRIGNAQAGLDRTDEFIAQSGGVLHRAEAVGGSIGQLGGHHVAVVQGVAQQDALNVLDLHIGAQGVGEIHVTGKIGVTALQVGGIVAGLQDDLVHDGLESILQAGAGGGEVLVHVGFIRHVGILGDGYVGRAAGAVLDGDAHRAAGQAVIGSPQPVGEGRAVRIHHALRHTVVADVEAQGVEQAAHVGIHSPIMSGDPIHHVGGGELSQEGVTGRQIALVAVAHVGGDHGTLVEQAAGGILRILHIGIVGGAGGGSAVGHQHQDGHTVVTGLPVVVPDDGIHLLEHLLGLPQAGLDVGAAAEGLGVVQVSARHGAGHAAVHRYGAVVVQVQVYRVATVVGGGGGVPIDGQNAGDAFAVGGATGLAGGRIQHHAHAVVLIDLQQLVDGAVGRADEVGFGIGILHRAGEVQHQHRVGGHGGIPHHLFVGRQRGQSGEEVLVVVEHRHLAVKSGGVGKDGLVRPHTARIGGVQIVQIEILRPVMHGIGIRYPIKVGIVGHRRQGGERH